MTHSDPTADIDDQEDDLPPPFADGWDEEDAAWLKELAGIGMNIARAMNRKVEAQQAAFEEAERAGEMPTPPDMGKTALDYMRLSRAIRMTLALKAWAQGGEGPGPSFRGFEGPGPEDDDDDPNDPENFSISYAIPEEEKADWNRAKHDARMKAYIRLAMSHLIEGFDPPERERLWDTLELRLERESEKGDRFRVADTNSIVESLCKEFGVECEWRAGLNRDGQYQAWIIGREGDGTGPRYFEDLNPLAKCLDGPPNPPLKSKGPEPKGRDPEPG